MARSNQTTTPLEIDGATGEGGGQLVRMATALAAVTLQPIRIVNIRAKRPKGGLKSQHLTSIKWLAEATNAAVNGLEIGSDALSFSPQTPPTSLLGRRFSIKADSSAASALLILQALLPYLIFAGGVPGSNTESDPEPEPIEVEISGGTNVSFSPSYEYLDQILLPALQDRFGIVVERRLVRRGWSLGPQSRGGIWVRVQPLRPGQSLKAVTVRDAEEDDGRDKGPRTVVAVDASVVAPARLLDELKAAITRDARALFPRAETNFVAVEDSGHDSRIYVLLVARASGGRVRWGHDVLASTPKAKEGRGRPLPMASETAVKISRKVCRGLQREVRGGGEVDEHLQDQLVCFQALAEGVSVVLRGDGVEGGGEGDGDGEEGDTRVRALGAALGALAVGGKTRRADAAEEPFGYGSTHTRTARWVAAEMLPAVRFYNSGTVCEGAGISFASEDG